MDDGTTKHMLSRILFHFLFSSNEIITATKSISFSPLMAKTSLNLMDAMDPSKDKK
jgi:hypothetical protein